MPPEHAGDDEHEVNGATVESVDVDSSGRHRAERSRGAPAKSGTDHRRNRKAQKCKRYAADQRLH